MPLILFDIDRTLYDTGHFQNLVSQKLAKFLNLPLSEYLSLNSAYVSALAKSTDFYPPRYLAYLAHRFHVSYSSLHHLYFSPDNFISYPDVLPVLKQLSSRYTLGILTEGFPSFQAAKLRLTGLLPIFDPSHIYVRRRKLSPRFLKSLPPGTIIVDDNPPVISALSQYPHLRPLHLNRLTSTLSELPI